MTDGPNHYQPRRISLLTFSVNVSGDIFLWLRQPDLVLEFHKDDYHHDALLRWCQAKARKRYVDVDMPIIEDDGDW